MIAEVVGTIGVAFVSAFVPAVPVEPYLIGLVATTGSAAVPLGIAAGVGQTAGKVLIFLATRGAVRSQRLRAWLARKAAANADRQPSRLGRSPSARRIADALRWLTARLDRPATATPIVLISALVGIPPLFAVAVYAGRTRMGWLVFTAACFVGRAVRFVGVALAPQVFL